MRRIRVLHVNKLYAPAIGGVEGVVQALAEEALASGDVEGEVLACQPHGSTRVDIVNGVRVTRVGSAGTFLSMPLAPTFPGVLRRMRADFDIVHVHVPFPLPMFAGWGGSGEPRLVIHYHCDLSRWTQRAILGTLEPWNRQMFAAADRIIVTSENLRQHSPVLQRYVDKCRVVPLPVDATRFVRLPESAKQELRSGHGVAPHEKVVLSVGRFVYYKGLSYLLEAMRDVPAQLVMVGDGPLRPSLERQVVALGLGHKIRMLGRVDNRELQTLYQMADVFVLPSTHPAEAFGLVQLEAMANGCPVVNTDLPTGVPSVSLHRETGLTVPARNARALAHALNELLIDDALRLRYAARALERVRLFERTTVAKSVHDLYEQILSGLPGTTTGSVRGALQAPA